MDFRAKEIVVKVEHKLEILPHKLLLYWKKKDMITDTNENGTSHSKKKKANTFTAF